MALFCYAKTSKRCHVLIGLLEVHLSLGPTRFLSDTLIRYPSVKLTEIYMLVAVRHLTFRFHATFHRLEKVA